MKETNAMYPRNFECTRVDTDCDSLLDTSSTGQDNPLVNNNSVTSFIMNENEISITRSIGNRKYSTMSFKSSPCKGKVDILVTHGLYDTEAKSQAIDMSPPGKEFYSQSKLPDPPWPAKLCLGTVFVLVIAMSVVLIIFLSMFNIKHISQSMPPVKGPEHLRTFVDGNYTSITPFQENNVDYTILDNEKDALKYMSDGSTISDEVPKGTRVPKVTKVLKETKVPKVTKVPKETRIPKVTSKVDHNAKSFTTRQPPS